jgi:hypothetical protein
VAELAEAHSIAGYKAQEVPGAAAAGPLLPPSTLNNRVVPAGEEEDPEAKEVAEACNSAGVQTGFYSSLVKKKKFWMDIKFNERQT